MAIDMQTQYINVPGGFVGLEVLCVHADSKYMDEKGKFDLSKSNPIVYSHGEYFSLGKKLGKFGYSVKKN